MIYTAFLKELDSVPVDQVSLDVFETIITRRVCDPTSVFLKLGQELFGNCCGPVTPEAFTRARLRAEARARRVKAPPADVTLKNIYGELLHECPELLPWHSRMMEAELALEESMIYCIPGAQQLVASIRGRFGRVVFISDMYLPTSFIRRLLAMHGLLQSQDVLYVSCDCGLKKSHQGALFRHVLAEEQGNPSRWLHVGDNPRADGVVVRNLGMRAQVLRDAAPNRFEKALETSRWDSQGLGSALGGASRHTRLNFAGDRPDPMVRVIAGVAAPLFTGFLLWLFQRARQSGIQRLYFLAREGEVLFELAELLNKRLELDLDLRYLYVSRRSLNPALLASAGPSDMPWAITHQERLTLREALLKLSMTPESLETVLANAGFPPSSWDAVLSKPARQQLFTVLAQDVVLERIKTAACSERALVEEYLRGEGFYDPEPLGLVDTTGSGSQLRTLARLRSKQELCQPEGFLILRNWKPNLPEDGFPTVHGYIADHYAQLGWCGIGGLTQMLEVFALTDYGTVMGYERNKRTGGIDPVFETGTFRRSSGWSQVLFRDLLAHFVTELDVSRAWFETGVDVRSGIVDAFTQFWENPAEDEAQFWGAFEFELGSGGEHSYDVLAPSLRLRDLFALARGRPLAGHSWHTWASAVRHRSPVHIKCLVACYRWLRRVKGSLQIGARRGV